MWWLLPILLGSAVLRWLEAEALSPGAGGSSIVPCPRRSCLYAYEAHRLGPANYCAARRKRQAPAKRLPHSVCRDLAAALEQRCGKN